MKRLLALSALGGLGLLLGLGAVNFSSAATTSANLWVDGNGGTCARQATAGAYVDAQACSSFDAAYLAASPGDTVAVQPGSYGDMTVNDSSGNGKTLGSSPVTFCVASGDVTVTDMGTYGHDITFSGAYCGLSGQQDDHLTVSNATNGGIAVLNSVDGIAQRNVTVSNVHASNLFVNAGGFTLQFSQIGPNPNAPNCGDLVQLWWHGGNDTADSGRLVGTRILHNWIHDDLCASGNHNDGIQIEANQNTLVDGNYLAGCHQLFFDGARTSSALQKGNVFRNNMVAENATGSAPENGAGCGSFNAVSSGQEILYENNTIQGPFDNGYNGADSVTRNNIFLTGALCDSRICDHNVFVSAGNQGTNGKVCTPRLANGSLYSPVNNSAADWHLSLADTCAAGAGDPANFPALDIDGETRTAPVWAGADQPSGVLPPPPTTSTVTITTAPTTTTTTTVPTTTSTPTVTVFVTTTLPAVTTTVSDCVPDPGYANCTAEIGSLTNLLAAIKAWLAQAPAIP